MRSAKDFCPVVILHAPRESARAFMHSALQSQAIVDLQVTSTEAELLAALPGAQALVMQASSYSRAVATALHAAPGLRWLQLLSSGYEGVQEHGVPRSLLVSNAGDAFSASVAEHAMALLLALVRQVPASVLSAPFWDKTIAGRVRNLAGMTLAIVGYGSIGRGVAQRSKAFGMRVIVVRQSARQTDLADDVFGAGQLKTALAQADAVVLALPLSSGTSHLINYDTLVACKHGVLLVNVSRGGVVDHDALVFALRGGQVGGAALDVTDPEPLPSEAPLWTCPNLLVTPHLGGLGPLSDQRLVSLVQDNLQRFCSGHRPLHVVYPSDTWSA